jgi:hypothetical protein
MLKKLESKKGVSMMVSYTLLIVIAVAISVLVYGYLKTWLPGERPECPSGFNLIIEDSTCDKLTEELDIRVSNKGLFNISAAFIRMGVAGRTVRFQVNNKTEFFPGGPISPNSNARQIKFPISHILSRDSSITDWVIEIQPAIFEKNTLYPCEKAIINQPITCQ